MFYDETCSRGVRWIPATAQSRRNRRFLMLGDGPSDVLARLAYHLYPRSAVDAYLAPQVAEPA